MAVIDWQAVARGAFERRYPRDNWRPWYDDAARATARAVANFGAAIAIAGHFATWRPEVVGEIVGVAIAEIASDLARLVDRCVKIAEDVVARTTRLEERVALLMGAQTGCPQCGRPLRRVFTHSTLYLKCDVHDVVAMTERSNT